METIISPVDERRMVCAIEKAASLSLVKDDADRSELLADCLKSEHVPARFAKTASAAYNKRLTVLTFEKRADEHKADSFALADPERVTALMGDVVKQSKTASVAQTSFKLSVEKPAMSKAASVAELGCKPVNYEDRVDNEVFKKHIESVFDKQAALLGDNLRKLESAECQLNEARERLANYLTKSASGASIIDTACNLYGRAFMDFMRDALPGVHMMKTASGAVKPNAGVYDEIEAMLNKHAAIEHERDFLTANAEGVAEFGKSASHMLDVMADAEYNYTENMRKSAAIEIPNTPPPPVAGTSHESAVRAYMESDAGQSVVTPTAAELFKTPAAPKRTPREWLGTAAQNGARMALGLLPAVPQLGAAQAKAVANAYGDLLGNARAKLDAVRETQSASPGDVVGASFIFNDRYMDRLMGWSDVCADKSFSMYPAEEVFTATQRAMDLNPALERPDNRELLKVNVGKLLAQNGRASSADMAELATTLKALGEAQQGIAADARDVVKDLSDKTGPATPTLKALHDIVSQRGAEYAAESKAVHDQTAELFKAIAEENQKRDDSRKERWEKAVDASRSAKREADSKLRDMLFNAREKDLADANAAAAKAQEKADAKKLEAAKTRKENKRLKEDRNYKKYLTLIKMRKIDPADAYKPEHEY